MVSVAECAKELMSEYKFLYLKDQKKTLYYENGTYMPNGDTEIMEQAYKRVDDCTISKSNQVVKIIQVNSNADMSVFDIDSNLVNLRNGIYNIKTSTLSPHTPDIPFQNQMNVIYDESAKAEKFEEFLSQVVPNPNDRTTIYEMYAAPLLSDLNLNRILVCVGEGPAGKSVLWRVMSGIYGDCTADVWMQDVKRLRSHLIGKKIIKYDTSLIEKKDFNLLKKHHLDGIPNIFCQCEKVKIKDDLFRLVHFPKSFYGDAQNVNLFEELVKEKSGILNILLKHAKTLRETKRLTYPQDTISIKKPQITDGISDFISMIETVDGSIESKKKMYDAFVEFCKSRKTYGINSQTFSRRLSDLGYKSKKTRINGIIHSVWTDVRLKS